MNSDVYRRMSYADALNKILIGWCLTAFVGDGKHVLNQ